MFAGMGESQPFRTALHDAHLAGGAEMAEQAGWLVPVHYGDADAEAAALTARAGVFDSSRLGRIRIAGDGALDLLERACTADAARQEDDTALLTAICDEAGVIIDVCFIVRLESFWVITTNAAARPVVLEHLTNIAADVGAKVDDQTFKTSMITVAGPGAMEVLDPLLPHKASQLARRQVKTGSMLVARYIAMRTGSTGLWSMQVMLPNMLVRQAWRYITQKAGESCLPAIGTAAQDTLGRRAGVPGPADFAGKDPITAGLSRLVDFDHDFLGRAALLAIDPSGATS